MFLALRLAFSRWRSQAIARVPARAHTSDQPLPPPADPSTAPPADPADALWRAARGEPSPFRRDALYLEIATLLVESAGAELVRFCERHVDGPATAEDVAQRAFVTFWQLLPRFEGRSSLRTFLFGIAHNLCRRALRSEQRSQRRFDLHEDNIRAEVHPDHLAEIDEDGDRVQRLATLERTLAMMDEREAWLLRARFVDEHSYAEMLPRYQARFGAHITTPEGLRTAVFHARKRLETLLRRSS